MKRFAIFGAFALAACSGSEEPANEGAMVEEPVVEEMQVMSADGLPPEGTYEITSAGGDLLRQVVYADGTYANVDEDGNEINGGTWSQDDPNRWCSTEEGGEEHCFTETIDEDGVWMSVNEDDPDDYSTIVRVE